MFKLSYLYYISCVWPSQSSTANSHSSFALCFSSWPLAFSTSDVFLGQFLPNGVRVVICHVPLSVTKMRWQGPWGTSHSLPEPRTLVLVQWQEGSERGQWGGGMLYTAKEHKKEKIAYCRPSNQREKSCINHDNTFGRQPPLHQRREKAWVRRRHKSMPLNIWDRCCLRGLGRKGFAFLYRQACVLPIKSPMACTQDF